MKKIRMVCGVGINDADYMTQRKTDAGKWICPFYRAWTDMLRRCYSEKNKRWNPAYSGCTVSPQWHSFSEFKRWMSQQDYEGNDLDKDLLFPGNKIYSPETCIFISQSLNKFVADNKASRGEWPLGVYWHKGNGRFAAHCRNPFTGKQVHIGLFDDPESAHESWRNYKHQIALIYADLQVDPRLAQNLRSRYAPSRREAGHHSDDGEYQVIEPTRLPHGPDECAKAQLDILSQ
jgi:hypothetical protein